MKICKERNVVLVERVQKALFWQDLLSCLMSGTGRVMRHGDFVDFRIKRRSDWEGKYVVPPGLATVCQGWADEFVVVLEDLNALCARIDEECVQDTTPVDILPIENYQASLESRVVDCISDFRKSGIPDDPLQEACMYATYMCIYKLSLGVWEGCYIPEVCVSQIFRCVTLLVQDSRINQCRGICLWLLCFAGMMTTRKEARQRVCELIHTIMDPDTGIKTNDWTTARYVMRQFIWCNYAFEQPVRDFWNHFISVQSQAKKQFPKSIYKPTHQQNRTTQLRANIKI